MEELDQKLSRALPFSDSKQNAILGHLVHDEKFFKFAQGKIQPHWFRQPYVGKVFEAKLNFVKKFNRAPTLEELQQSQDFLLESQEMRNRMYAAMAAAQNESKNFGLDALSPELTSWLKCRVYHEAVEASVKQFNAERWDKAADILNEALKEYVQLSFDGTAKVDWEDLTFLNKSIEERKNALTFGLKIFDQKLLPGNESGSLLPGDTTVLMGPKNVGKTTVMITIMRHNVWAGKSILYIPIEGKLFDIQEKLLCSMLDCNKVELLTLYKTPEGKERLKTAWYLLKRQLDLVPQLKAGLNVEDIAAIIRKKQQEREAFEGRGYDLVVIDYPAKLGTRLAEGGHMQRRHIDAYVYNYLVMLAQELNYHSLVAIQVNREGSKINRGLKGSEERLLVETDVLESWEVVCTATNVVTLNRTPAMVARNVLTFYICNSRSSETGWAIAARSNYGNCITHSDAEKQGATAYRGEGTHPERIGDLLLQWKNKEIPVDVLYKPAA